MKTRKERTTPPDMSGLSSYQKLEALFFLFCAGALGGFLYEEIYCLIINTLIEGMPFPWRGMLYGPYLPIYGFGVLILHFLFRKWHKHPLFIFFGTVIAMGVFEYVCGWAFLRFAGFRLWNYTGRFMNLHGHVSLQSVTNFGLLALGGAYFVEPAVFRGYLKTKPKTRTIIAAICLAILLTDLIITLIFPNDLGKSGIRFH